MTRRKPKLEPRKCRQCGAEYVPNNNRQMYCSKRCRVTAASQNMRSKNETLYRQAKVAVAALDNEQRTLLRVLMAEGVSLKRLSDEVLM